MADTTNGRPWHHDLQDGVQALGQAAGAYRSAYQVADALAALVDSERVQIHEGRVTGQPGPEARGWAAKPTGQDPHAGAVFDVAQIQRKHADELHRHYENAALLYASGAASAIRMVQAGDKPPRPVLPLGDDRKLTPGPLQIEGLADARYVGAEKLTAAYRHLVHLLDMQRYGDDLCARNYLADHEASAMHDAWSEANGIADAAYAYALLAETALNFVLLGAKREHERSEAR